MPTKLELNKTYYQLNKEKLKEKRRQRYSLNKNGKSEQSLTGQCSESSLNTTEQNVKPCSHCPELIQTNHQLQLRNKQLESENSKSWAQECSLKERKYQDLLKEYWELRKQLEVVATLPVAYIDDRETEIKNKHQKEIEKLKKEYGEKIKELEKKFSASSSLGN